MQRRQFLRNLAITASAAVSGTLMSPGTARGFGENPSGTEGVVLPKGRRAYNVLEVFLLGGLSPYESFYNVEAHGASTGTHWHLFTNGLNEVGAAVADCGYELTDLLEPFDLDAGNNEVNLGPFVAPFRSRPDIISRMRNIVTTHHALPHEVAIPLMLTGRTDSATSAGFGSHVQQYFQERETRTLPYSYVLLPPSSLQVELMRMATARGTHPTAARPLSLQLANLENFSQLLERSGLGARAEMYDRLIARRIELAGAGLVRPGAEAALESASMAQLLSSARAVTSASSLSGVLSDEALVSLAPGTACGVVVDQEGVGASIRLAAHLLTMEGGARYVCAVDGGFDNSDTNAAGGYDTHDNAALKQAQNLFNVLSQLAEVINRPGESDPKKLALDTTMIVLTTEFGRTPHEEGARGRGHWPFSYPTVVIGGPIEARSSLYGGMNGGIYGSVREDGKAELGLTPAALRSMMLVAMGIWPFDDPSFNVSDIAGAPTPEAAVEFLVKDVLGVSV